MRPTRYAILFFLVALAMANYLPFTVTSYWANSGTAFPQSFMAYPIAQANAPDGTSDYMMGSETEFTRRLARDGVKAWFCADAQVSHMIREHQLSVDWILQRAHRHGRSAYFLDHKIDSSAPTVFGVERWLYTQLVSSGLRAIAYLLRGRKSEWFKAMRLHYYTRGGLAQARAMRGRTGP